MTTEPKNLRRWEDAIDPQKYENEFWEVAQKMEFTDRNPLNTEMFFLWCVLKSRPVVNLYESGTFKGYSTEFLAKAIVDSPTEFTTIGMSLEDSYSYAKKRLAPYSNVTVIDDNSIDWVSRLPKSSQPCAWWIDGPKGRNLPPLLEQIGEKFDNVQWIAVHDAEPEDWSGNRKQTIKYFSDETPISFTEESFQEKYHYMDKPLIGRSELVPWYPYKQRGLEKTSYGTQTIFVWTEGKSWLDLKRK